MTNICPTNNTFTRYTISCGAQTDSTNFKDEFERMLAFYQTFVNEFGEDGKLTLHIIEEEIGINTNIIENVKEYKKYIVG